MTKEEPFSATFKQEKETKNTVRYSEESEDRRPVVLSRTGAYKLPFGNLPRLLLAWISTKAVRTQSRELILWDSLSEFMRVLGVYSYSKDSSHSAMVSGSVATRSAHSRVSNQ